MKIIALSIEAYPEPAYYEELRNRKPARYNTISRED